jgi:hypothetical protein
MLDLNKRKIELFDRLSSGAETHIDQYSDAQVQKLNAARKAARKAIFGRTYDTTTGKRKTS